jgi:hypothetical protein
MCRCSQGMEVRTARRQKACLVAIKCSEPHSLWFCGHRMKFHKQLA